MAFKSIMGKVFGMGKKTQQPNGIEGRVNIGDPKSVLTKPFDPAEFLGKGWQTWKGPVKGNGHSGEEDIDLRSLTLSEIEIAKFLFETGLREGEETVQGDRTLSLSERGHVVAAGHHDKLQVRHDGRHLIGVDLQRVLFSDDGQCGHCVGAEFGLRHLKLLDAPHGRGDRLYVVDGLHAGIRGCHPGSARLLTRGFEELQEPPKPFASIEIIGDLVQQAHVLVGMRGPPGAAGRGR